MPPGGIGMKTALSQLKLAGQVTPLVEIEDVRLLRLSGRVYPGTDREAKSTARFPLPRSTRYRQDGNNIFVEIRFSMEGVQEREAAKKLVDLLAIFEVSYRLNRPVRLSRPQLKAFSEINAPYNAWPYWRELVQGMIARMGLPRLVAPVFRIPRPSLDEQKPEGRTKSRSPSQNGKSGEKALPESASRS